MTCPTCNAEMIVLSEAPIELDWSDGDWEDTPDDSFDDEDEDEDDDSDFD